MEFRKIRITNGVYEVSESGVVRRFYKGNKYNGSVDRYKIITPCISVKGYYKVGLGRKFCSQYIHRLVAMEFLEQDLFRTHVNHKDGNKLNNHYSNLEWCTAHENNIHAAKVLGITVIKPCVAVSRKTREEIGRYPSKRNAEIELVSLRGILIIEEDVYSKEHVNSILDKPRKKVDRFMPCKSQRKLTDDQVRLIRKLGSEGMRHWPISLKVGCNSATVRNILENGSYRDVI